MTAVETVEADVEAEVLAPGTEIAPGYEVDHLISRGAALDVYEVFSRRRLCSCIAKTIRPDRAEVTRVRKRLLLEGHLLQTLAHPHLPRAYEMFPEPVPVLIVQTLVGPTLAELIEERSRRLPSADLAHLGRHLSSAVHYLNASGYLHLDIRPANVIAQGGIATLIDLSISRPPGPIRRGVGTRDYMAPEQARGDDVTPATDVWGLGVTLYEAATAVAPFAPLDDDEDQVYRAGGSLQLTRGARPLSTWGRRLHPGLAAVIEDCLHPEASGRPTVDAVHERLGTVLEELEPTE